MGDFDAIESTGEDPAYSCCDREIPVAVLESAFPASTPPPHRTSGGTSFASGVVTCDECDAETEVMVGTRLGDDRRLEVDVRTAPADASGFDPDESAHDAADDAFDGDSTEGPE